MFKTVALHKIALAPLLITFIAFSAQSLIAQQQRLRVATLNASFYRDQPGELAKELSKPGSSSAEKIAAIIQRVRPDVILINEFDYDKECKSVAGFKKNYLENSQAGGKPINYPFHFQGPVNTGVDSGFDLNGNGIKKEPADGFGFGKFPGQYGMLVLSKFPFDRKQSRTFQKFKWSDLPNALKPLNVDGTSYYKNEVWNQLRLSSKSHWDVVVDAPVSKFHFLVSHPTPPVFDGEEDRNGKRNHDEIRFWLDYIGSDGKFIYDDRKKRGGLGANAPFVIAGDLNADPFDGDSTQAPTRRLLNHSLTNHLQTPSSRGGLQAGKKGTANLKHRGEAQFDTADFNDEKVGNLRVDYVVPSKHFKIQSSGVFWPPTGAPDAELVEATDHRLVWVDLVLKSNE